MRWETRWQSPLVGGIGGSAAALWAALPVPLPSGGRNKEVFGEEKLELFPGGVTSSALPGHCCVPWRGVIAGLGWHEVPVPWIPL